MYILQCFVEVEGQTAQIRIYPLEKDESATARKRGVTFRLCRMGMARLGAVFVAILVQSSRRRIVDALRTFFTVFLFRREREVVAASL